MLALISSPKVKKYLSFYQSVLGIAAFQDLRDNSWCLQLKFEGLQTVIETVEGNVITSNYKFVAVSNTFFYV